MLPCPHPFRTCLDRTSGDNGLGDVPPPVRFGGGLQRGDTGAIDGKESSPKVLLCDLPCLTVELSRLELVVLADMLAGFAPPPNEMPVVSSAADSSEAADAPLPIALEVLVEASGATIVLHEAAAFAEDPGPHSFVLNLGSACLHLGRRDNSIQGCPAPLVTISSGDLCVHETLRRCLDGCGDEGGRGRITGPLLFLPGRSMSAHPSMDDLPILGFVSVSSALKCFQNTCKVLIVLSRRLPLVQARFFDDYCTAFPVGESFVLLVKRSTQRCSGKLDACLIQQLCKTPTWYS